MCNNANGWSQTLGSRFGTPSLCTATAADVICATKLIPKGFLISATNTITIYSVGTNILNMSLSVACRSVNQPTLAPGSLGNPFVLATSYGSNTTVPLTGLEGTLSGRTAIGDGYTMIIIYLDPAQQLTTSAGGITGAIITMTRI